jgi:2-hydroxy-6-oxonona-2,4-dienedioate hydrolase
MFTVDHRPGHNGTSDDKPVVVLIPALFAGGWIWDEQVEGLSDWPVLRLVEPICALGRAAGDVDKLRSGVLHAVGAHGYHDFVAVGASFGATLAVDLATHERARAVLGAGVPGFGPPFDTGLSPNERLATDKLREWVVGATFYDPDQVREEYIETLRQTLTVNVVGTMRGSRAIEAYDIVAAARAATVPTRFVWGAQDGIASFVDYPADRPMDLIDHCGHLPSVERPAEFTEKLVDFLYEVAS